MTYRASLYTAFYNLVLGRLDAERAHRVIALGMRILAKVPGALRMLDRALGPRRPELRVKAMGLELRSPLGVAAGLDKDATWYLPLGALGFGAVEVGTVTAEPQEGNEARPRITRLPHDRALLNALGFPSDGSRAGATRLQAGRGKAVTGVNIGGSKDAGPGGAVAEYRTCTRRLAAVADYLALNVSSPNTPGLRELQSVDRLGELIRAVREEMGEVGARCPVLVKLSADLGDAEVEQVADLAMKEGIDGIIAVNTTTDDGLAAGSGAELAAQSHDGGLSGPPLAERSLEVLRLLRERTQGRLTLVSVGGVESHLDAWDRILAGASIVQCYTALVYGGPLWPRRVNRGLERLVRESPWDSIEDAVGRGSG